MSNRAQESTSPQPTERKNTALDPTKEEEDPFFVDEVVLATSEKPKGYQEIGSLRGSQDEIPTSALQESPTKSQESFQSREEELKNLKESLKKMKRGRMQKTTQGNKHPPETVQEVEEGQETPMIKSRRSNIRMRNVGKQRSQFNYKSVRPLFPYPEGNTSYDSTLNKDKTICATRISQQSDVAPADGAEDSKFGAKPKTASSVPRQPTYSERQRQMEINRQNKRLLCNMLRIEKDLNQIKRNMTAKANVDMGTVPQTLSQTHQTRMLLPEFHTSRNRRNEQKVIA